MEILRGVEGIGIVEFDKRDIVRHPLVKHIVEAFDRSVEGRHGIPFAAAGPERRTCPFPAFADRLRQRPPERKRRRRERFER